MHQNREQPRRRRAARVPMMKQKIQPRPSKLTRFDTASLFAETEESEAVTLPENTEAHVRDELPDRPKKKLWLWIPLGCVALLLIGYLTFVYCPFGFVARMRQLYIQTAMSTADHQWLATAFIPQSVIDAAWDGPITRPDTPDDGFLGVLSPSTTEAETETAPETETEPVSGTERETEAVTDAPDTAPDILGLADLRVGEKDAQGSTVLVVDEEEGLYIAEFTKRGWWDVNYHGYVMLIDDPSRVFVGTTPEKTVRGYRIAEMMDYYGDVVAGINASGFADPNDCGTGCDIIGACMSEGQFWGTYTDTMASIVLTEDNRLVAGWTGDWENYSNIRDGMQFGPVLVSNGVNKVDEKSGGGMGMQPRTAIGQREDGAIIMIVIDGRVLSSVGCAIWDMADMMLTYGAVTAGCCDGGSSVVLSYEGEVLNDNSSANPTYGRRIPNAFLVRSKKAGTEAETEIDHSDENERRN